MKSIFKSFWLVGIFICPVTSWADDCPKDWLEWISESVRAISRVQPEPAGTVIENADRLHKVIVSCRDKVPIRSKEQECLKPVEGFLNALARMGRKEGPQIHRYGMKVPDPIYQRAIKDKIELPAQISENQDLLRALRDPKGIPLADHLLSKLNRDRVRDRLPPFKFFRYQSRGVKIENRDEVGAERLAIVWPGNPSKVMVLNLPSHAQDLYNPEGFAVASFAQSPGQPWQVYFGELRRAYIHISDVWVMANDPGESCLRCHQSGSYLFDVVPGSVPDFMMPDYQATQMWMRKMGAVGFGGFFDPDEMGPGLGELPFPMGKESSMRTEFFQQCAAKKINARLASDSGNKEKSERLWKSVNLKRLESAMSCARCHDGTPNDSLKRGKIFPPFSNAFRLLNEGRMPPPSHGLDELGLAILNDCLLSAYAGYEVSDERGKHYRPGTLYQSLIPPSCRPK